MGREERAMRDDITTLTNEALSTLLWMTGAPLLALLPEKKAHVTHVIVKDDEDLSDYHRLTHVRILPQPPLVETTSEEIPMDNDRISSPLYFATPPCRRKSMSSDILLPPSVTHVELVGTASLHVDQSYEKIRYLTADRSYSHDWDAEGYMDALGLIRSNIILDSAVGDLRLELNTPYRYKTVHEYTHSLTLSFSTYDLTKHPAWVFPPNLTALTIRTKHDVDMVKLMSNLPPSLTALTLSGAITEQHCLVPSHIRTLTVESTHIEWTGVCLILQEGLTYVSGVHKVTYPTSLKSLVYRWPVSAVNVSGWHKGLDLHCESFSPDVPDACEAAGVALYPFSQGTKE